MIEEFKAALQEVAKVTGRRGDTILAHITPEEEAYLEREFGGSTTNPVTGLKEYAGEPGAGRGGQGESGGGGGGGSGGGGGGGHGGFGGGMSEADAPSNLGRAAGPAGPAVGRGRGRGTPGISGSDAPGTGGMRGGFGAQPSSSLGNAPGSSTEGRAISRALSMPFDIGLLGLMGLNPFGRPEEDLGLVTGVVSKAAETLGAIKDSLLGETSAQFGKVESADPQGPTGVGVSPPGGVPGGHPDTEFPSPGPPDYSLKRPDEMEAPHFLGLGNAMTPLQQRSALATYGTAGEAGGYRSDPAQEYYKNLFLRNVLGEQGEVLGGAQVLPVEAQYAQRMGYDVTSDMGVENFARALSELPSAERVAEFMNAWNAAYPEREVEQR